MFFSCFILIFKILYAIMAKIGNITLSVFRPPVYERPSVHISDGIWADRY